ncbi:response regulator transcription factor [Exiguobacterium sp. SH3S2]|uniref:response regulator transcription factor n=1 Tax=unclassified Exiguobacterium TaxID=2644629 RepID=UPI00103A09DB|nr:MULTISPECIES: response regulator transcription factor [unclassified Exiguobacterium]TCI42165.1 response regulator transcription factor [Exiguobacterium sp. SH3S3]TCI58171.1 response regulator transcription factor [Exiguobacterium sp. SH3S2]
MKILIVDDEVKMRRLLRLFLEDDGYTCIEAADGQEAMELISERPDLVMLDIMMPGTDGITLCRQIKALDAELPVVLLTARSDSETTIRGLDAGADDYVTKPFEGNVLLARIRAVLRRSRMTNVSYGQLRYEEASGRILYQEQEIVLTPKATAILKLFLQHPNRLYNRMDLYDLVWPYSSESDPRTVDAHIRMIRDKIGEAGFPIDDYLKTVWGRGYRWTEERPGT